MSQQIDLNRIGEILHYYDQKKEWWRKIFGDHQIIIQLRKLHQNYYINKVKSRSCFPSLFSQDDNIPLLFRNNKKLHTY